MYEVSAEEYEENGLFDNFNALWKGKYWILSSGFAAAVVSVLIVLMLPNIYRADVMLSPISETKPGALAGIASQLGGLASLAGVSLMGGGSVDKATMAIETLKSRVFLTDFIKRHEMAIPLIAADAWDPNSGDWVIDPEIYDLNEKKWVRKVKPPKSIVPSDLEMHKVFSKMISVNQDKKTQIVTLSVDSFSPEFAQIWARALVDDINSYIKKRDVEQAERSINYLAKEIEATPISQMQAVLYQLIEEQKKTVMLASVRDGYVFQTIDPAVIPEEKYRPKRALIVFFSTSSALLVAAMVVLLINGNKSTSKKLEMDG